MSGHTVALNDAIRARVKTWADASFDFDRVELPNEAFTQPSPDPSNASATSWVRVQILGVDSRQISIGPDGKREHRRLLHFDVFVPTKIKAPLAWQIADSIADAFRSQTDLDSSVIYEEPDIHESDTQEDPWYRWAVSIPVRYQFHP